MKKSMPMPPKQGKTAPKGMKPSAGGKSLPPFLAAMRKPGAAGKKGMK